ncbi:prepilin-type N-terminal cleavage/methylation domain-containing protein [Oribacterium sp. KHPX15]|uniref:type IV pilin protein n=1 Tax=Oribacterium sp. KHPX15 TaxID=1855342 RepID=UPI0008965C65|nr:type II secretion system protein [Oribacterium sp. KHPX15]SEA30828.1 prepilin-type N-terminal cleavage/methylation domain-containing protein [Oribacterium sp. KHPX15]
MFKKINKKGFTLAELLIVVAIIGVLVAISIPIFTAQLRKAKLATNQANARAAYAAVVAKQLQEGYTGAQGTYTVSTAQANVTSYTTDVTANSRGIDAWSVSYSGGWGKGNLGDIQVTEWIVSIDGSGDVSIAANAVKS